MSRFLEYMEHLTGREALKQLPLTDCLLPINDAVNLLTVATHQAIDVNINRMLARVDPHHADLEEAKVALAGFQEAAKSKTGGCSYSDTDLREIYDYFGTKPFEHLVDYMLSDIFPKRIAIKPEV